jgi:hypothetical protein
MTGCWRKLHNEELNNLYPTPITIRIDRQNMWHEWGKEVVMYVFVGKAIKKLGRIYHNGPPRDRMGGY